ncbi:MAG: hypothetical protein HN919_17895 [Verrucomicrobia bacterium]|nr:hypothetical protein [Verrucomicrobiota bacterium]MBT7700429.1 hypothetical protein [Verrucomicrobiota bacterium]
MDEPRSGEDAESVGASKTLDIADHAGHGAGRARAQQGCSTARDRPGGNGIDERA